MTVDISAGLRAADAPQATRPQPAATPRDPALWRTAQAFETAFMTEMLKHAGVAEMDTPFSKGHGEEAFRSFLVREYASALTDRNALGLAEKVYAELKQKAAHNE